MSRICDRRPCKGLTAILPLLTFKMLGESNQDLRAVLTVVSQPTGQVSNGSAPEPVSVSLMYCPFCGMRLEEDVIEFMQRARVPNDSNSSPR